MELRGKNALVLGASQGIGQATAIALSERGACVTALARNESNLEATLKQLHHQELGHRMIVCDLLNLTSLETQITKALESQAFQILVCNAGGPKPGPIAECSMEVFSDAFKIHILANTRLVQMLLPGMKDMHYGRIINIISTSVKAPIPNLGISNTIRGAVASWAKTLANELGPYGITVNNVLPGFTKTSRLDSLLSNTAKRLEKSETQVSDMWQASVPARRFGEPFEVAAACAFLASPVAGYCNGINLPVDGGRTPSL